MRLRDLFTFGETYPTVEATRPAEPRAPRVSPLNFQLDIPPEMAAGSSGLDGVLEPRVGRRAAMTVPAVKRARDLICGTLGVLPLRAYNIDTRVRLKTGSTASLLGQPEHDYARSISMTHVLEDMLFHKYSWWRVTKFGFDGYPVEVRRLDPLSMSIRKNWQVYTSDIDPDRHSQGGAWEWVPDAELIRFESPHDALLEAGAATIRDAIKLRISSGNSVDGIPPLSYFAPKDGVADQPPETVDAMLDEWEASRRRRATAYVGSAVELKTLAWSPEQLQLAAQRDYLVLEIARLVGLDPEELGVAINSKTYANAEMRRLDLIDFVLAAYVSAVEGRLSMNDVCPRNVTVRFDYTGFLRSDTLTRMQVYAAGRGVGAYNDQRIAEEEWIPSARIAPVPAGVPVVTPEVPAVPAPAAAPVKTPPPGNQRTPAPSAAAHMRDQDIAFMNNTRVSFGADDVGLLRFDFPTGDAASFAASTERRTISGQVIPWNTPAMSKGRKWSFAPGSLHWSSDVSRVKLNKDHNRDESFAAAKSLANTDTGLNAAFGVGRGTLGDQMLFAAEDHVYDGMSVEVEFSSPEDAVEYNDQTGAYDVSCATLVAVALTAMPAFDAARVAAVVASREEAPMSAPVVTPPAPAAPAPATAGATLPDMATFTAGLEAAFTAAMTNAIAALPTPQLDPGGREVVRAGRAFVGREAPVYAMNGNGHSMVKDAWKARTEGDSDARDRLAKFTKQTQDAAQEAADQLTFGAANTTNAAAVIPPGYRPELYVTQLMQGRPLVNSVSRGSLTDATPFTLPSFTSATSMTSAHTEGTNPTSGTLTIGTITVTPGATSGVFQLTREIMDSSNPAIDAIAMQAMQESYSQQTEAKVYAELNGTNGQGGTITAGFTPSGAQTILVNGLNGDGAAGTATNGDFIRHIRAQQAVYPFRRFAAPNRALASQAGVTAMAGAVDSTGRPLLPSVGPQNTVGVGNAISQGWVVDGLVVQPAWSMTGNAITDSDLLMFNSNDVWYWESGLLTFRFEERSGPANIDLALFGYSATRLLRPRGLSSIRFDTTPV